MSRGRYRSLQKRPDGIVSICLTKPLEAALLPLIVRLPFPPEAWTWLSFAAKVAAAGWILAGGAWWAVPLWLAAALVLDGFDGDVARFRGKGSFRGACLDAALDAVGSGLVVAAFASLLPRPLGVALVFLEVLDRTAHVWADVTGKMLADAVRPFGFQSALLKRGVLPWFHMDLLYFLLGVGPLVASFEATAGLVVALYAASLVTFLAPRLSACRSAEDGPLARRGFVRKIAARTAFFAVLYAAGAFLLRRLGLPEETPLFLALADHFLFTFAATPLTKAAHLAPLEGEARRAYFEDLRRRNLAFLGYRHPAFRGDR